LHTQEWRNRPLQEIYTMLFIDGIQYKMREDGRIKSKVLYSVIGINLEGKKEILGLWIMEREDAKGWLRVQRDSDHHLRRSARSGGSDKGGVSGCGISRVRCAPDPQQP